MAKNRAKGTFHKAVPYFTSTTDLLSAFNLVPPAQQDADEAGRSDEQRWAFVDGEQDVGEENGHFSAQEHARQKVCEACRRPAQHDITVQLLAVQSCPALAAWSRVHSIVTPIPTP